jgi:serine/threonine protein kinase
MRTCSECGRCYDGDNVDLAFCVDDGGELIDGRDGGIDVVPGYTLERRVASHAGVDTYVAKQTETSRDCVVRLLVSGANDEQFLADAATALAFFHPNVADIYEAGRLDSGDLFVVSELPRGRTLRRILEEKKTGLLAAIEIVRQTAEAVHALHLKSLTHGAVRPENIVVTKQTDGTPLVRLRASTSAASSGTRPSRTSSRSTTPSITFGITLPNISSRNPRPRGPTSTASASCFSKPSRVARRSSRRRPPPSSRCTATGTRPSFASTTSICVC